MEVGLTVYDVGLHQAGCGCHYLMEFEGQLQQQQMAQGLQRALAEYPLFAGSIRQCADGTHALSCPKRGSLIPLLDGKRTNTTTTTSSSSSSAAASSSSDNQVAVGYQFSYRERDTRPMQDTTFKLWWSRAMPPTHNILSSARVTCYKDCNRSLLVFVWDHAICDVAGAVTFLTSWFRYAGAQHDTALLSAGTCGAPPAQQDTARLGAPARTTEPQLVSAGAHTGPQEDADNYAPLIFNRLRYFSKPSAVAGVQWEFDGPGGSADSPPPASAVVLGAADALPLPAFAQLQTAACGDVAAQQLEAAHVQKSAWTDAQAQDEASGVQMKQQQDMGRGFDGSLDRNPWPDAMTEWNDSTRSPSSSNSSSPDKALSSSGGSSSTLRSLISRSSSTWSIRSSGAISGADGADGTGTNISFDIKQACQDWLSSTECPFPWDPRHLWLRFTGYWRLSMTLLAQFSRHMVWYMPRDFIETAKAKARAAYPLPPGMYYSTTIVTAAVLAAGMYVAEHKRYQQQGGLVVVFIVDCSGGRAGMDIPSGTISNPSVWGARVWVPADLLAAAAGWPTPELMYHLRTQLDAQLQDPQGVLNKQFAWTEAARRAGLSGRLYFGAQMLQCMDGEITLDALTTSPNSFPEVPGASLRYHLCRWVGISIPRFFLTQPAMAADGGTSSDGSSGNRGGVRLEGTLPGAVADRMSVVWQGLGLQDLKQAAQEGRYSIEAGGTMWTMWETLLLPHSVVLYYGFIWPFVLLWDQARSSCSRLAECASDRMQGVYKRINSLFPYLTRPSFCRSLGQRIYSCARDYFWASKPEAVEECAVSSGEGLGKDVSESSTQA